MNTKSGKRSVLGKGIASLIGGEGHNDQSPPPMVDREIKATSGAEVLQLDVNSLRPNLYQPRKIMKDDLLEELSQSIVENGIIQPILVSPDGENYQIIAGERRYRAAIKAGLKKVPVIVKNIDDREKLVMAIIENVQRHDLNCVEEALAYFRLMNEFNIGQEEVARRVGKERSTVANFLRILKLPKEVLEMIQEGQLSFGHAKVLASIKNENHIYKMANETVNNDWSVRELEKRLGQDPKIKKGSKKKSFADETMERLKRELEEYTGLHIDLKVSAKGSGQVVIKFHDQEGLEEIYKTLTK